MEQQVFLQKEVYTRLRDGFIEARMHMDGADRIGEDKLAANRLLQKKYSKSVALPTFVVVDPKTRKALGLLRGMRDAKRFLDFLAAAERKAPGKAPGKAQDKVGRSK